MKPLLTILIVVAAALPACSEEQVDPITSARQEVQALRSGFDIALRAWEIYGTQDPPVLVLDLKVSNKNSQKSLSLLTLRVTYFDTADIELGRETITLDVSSVGLGLGGSLTGRSTDFPSDVHSVSVEVGGIPDSTEIEDFPEFDG